MRFLRFMLVLTVALGMNLAGNAALAADIQSLEAWQFQADKWLAKGRSDKALELYNEAIAQYPANLDLLLKRGNLYLRLGNSEEAERDFQRVLFIDEKNVEGYLGMAVRAGCDGHMKDCYDYFARAIDLDGSNARAYMLRGRFYYEGIGDFEGALADYGRAEELVDEGQRPELLSNMMLTEAGYSVYYPEYWTETEALAAKLLDCPELPDNYIIAAYNLRMVAHQHMKDYRLALLDCQELMKLSGDNLEMQAYLLQQQSSFLVRLNMPFEARKAMLAALERNPQLLLPRRYELDPAFAKY